MEQVIGAKAACRSVAERQFLVLPVHGGFLWGAGMEECLLAAVVAEGGLGDGGHAAGDSDRCPIRQFN